MDTAVGASTEMGMLGIIPMLFWNVSDVTLKSFFIKDPPIWGLNIMNGTNMDIDDISVNATATGAAYGVNWVQNTDGFGQLSNPNSDCCLSLFLLIIIRYYGFY